MVGASEERELNMLEQQVEEGGGGVVDYLSLVRKLKVRRSGPALPNKASERSKLGSDRLGMAERRYSKLPTQQPDEQEGEELEEAPYFVRSTAHDDLRYRFELPVQIPWRSIALALFLLTLGTLMLIIAHFLYTEHMPGDTEQIYGFLVLGLLLFLPGFYETRIAYYSWRGANGYKFSQIPDY